MTETICSKCGGEVEPKQYTCLWRGNNREKYRETCRKAQPSKVCFEKIIEKKYANIREITICETRKQKIR